MRGGLKSCSNYVSETKKNMLRDRISSGHYLTKEISKRIAQNFIEQI